MSASPFLNFRFSDLDLTAPKIMGILNITPDSFSDGGRFSHINNAVAQARRMENEGAHIIDVGAESTRPNHTPLSADEELERLIPILKALPKNVPISVDTYKARTAEAALKAGAHIINDIWGLTHDEEMANVIANYNAATIIMYNRTEKDEKINIIKDMVSFFEFSLERAVKAGINRLQIVLDPGIGFGKTQAQNLTALQAIPKLKTYFGLPVLVGASRKSFINAIHKSDVSQRLGGTLAAHLYAVQKGADILRVHDVYEHVQALQVWKNLESLNG